MYGGIKDSRTRGNVGTAWATTTAIPCEAEWRQLPARRCPRQAVTGIDDLDGIFGKMIHIHRLLCIHILDPPARARGSGADAFGSRDAGGSAVGYKIAKFPASVYAILRKLLFTQDSKSLKAFHKIPIPRAFVDNLANMIYNIAKIGGVWI